MLGYWLFVSRKVAKTLRFIHFLVASIHTKTITYNQNVCGFAALREHHNKIQKESATILLTSVSYKLTMKKLFTFGAVLLIAAFAGGDAFGQNAPKVEFQDSFAHDFGEVYEGDSAVYFFVFKNTGNAPLIIKEVKGTCSCTATDWPKKPIPPGGQGRIRVEFDTRGKEAGQHVKGVNMYSNAGETNMLIYITIKKKA